MHDFDNYRAVAPDGTNLGTLVEIGSGPWTQSLPMLRARGFSVDRYVLLDPSALLYAAKVPSTVYRSGEVDIGKGGKVRPVVISAGAEGVDLLQLGSVDVLVCINVLEHVMNVSCQRTEPKPNCLQLLAAACLPQR